MALSKKAVIHVAKNNSSYTSIFNTVKMKKK